MTERHVPGRSLARFLDCDRQGAKVVSTRFKESDGERHGKRANWSIADSTLKEYSRTFSDVIPNSDLTQFLANQVSRYGYQSIIDIMASEEAVGYAVASAGFQRGVAVSLGMKHEPVWDERFGEGVIQSVQGDIVMEDTWSRIRSTQGEVSPRGFDVVLSRAEGGLTEIYLPADSALYYLLFQRIWSIAAPRSTLLLQVPVIEHIDANRYLSHLAQEGIEVHISSFIPPFDYGYGIRIEKMPSDPTRLPSPHKLGMKYTA